MKRKILSMTLVMAILLTILSFLPVSAASGKKIKLNKESITISVGKKYVLKVTTKTKVKWKSSNKKIATVNAKGIVKAKKVGIAKIIAYKGKQKAICFVKVKKNKVVNQSTKTPIPTTATPVPNEENDKIVVTVEQEKENPKKIKYTILNGTNELISFGIMPALEKEEYGNWNKLSYKEIDGLSIVGHPGAVIVKPNSEWSNEILLDDYFDNISSGKYRIWFYGLSTNECAIFTID